MDFFDNVEPLALWPEKKEKLYCNNDKKNIIISVNHNFFRVWKNGLPEKDSLGKLTPYSKQNIKNRHR